MTLLFEMNGALRDGDERYRSLIENSLGIIYTLTPDGTITFVSPGWHSLLGQSAKEAIGKSFQRYIHPDDVASCRAYLDHIIRSGQQKTGIEYRAKHADGSWQWHETNIVPQRDEEGRITGLNGIAVNIAERKRATQELKASESFYRTIFENTGNATVVLEDDTRISLANSKFEELSGYTKQEIEGRKFWPEFVVPADQKRLLGRHRLRRIDATLPPRSYEFNFLDKFGNVKNIVVTTDIIPGTQKSVASFLDITDLKKMEDALRTAENTYRNLFLNSQIGLFRLDIRNGRILDANDAAAKFIGYRDRAALLASPYRLSRQHIDSFNLTEALAHLRASGELKNGELLFRKNDGSSAWIRFSATLVDGKGWIEGVLEDITERKQIDDKLLQSEKNFRLSFDASPMGVRIVTRNGETVYANRAILDIYGYDHIEELRTLPASKRYTPESYAEFLMRREKRRNGMDEPAEYTVSIVRKNGEVRQLRVLRKEILWDGDKRFQVLYTDITEQTKAQEALKASRHQLRALAARLQQIREEERILMAREVHDEMGGGLSGLKMDLSRLLRKMNRRIPDEASRELTERIQSANALIDQMIGAVRRIATTLRPSILDDLGLIAALDWQAQEFASRTEIPCGFVSSLEDVNLSNETATDVFRIFQEALTNVKRHARATEVTVVFREGEKNHAGPADFILEIRDNGRGITREEISNPQSLGLLGMNERVLAFGGTLSISGIPGEGTIILLKIPGLREYPL